MVKRKHFNCLKYIDYLPEIIENPDYVGVNPNENDKSIEFIKKYSKNVLVGVKLEKDGQYLYGKRPIRGCIEISGCCM